MSELEYGFGWESLKEMVQDPEKRKYTMRSARLMVTLIGVAVFMGYIFL